VLTLRSGATVVSFVESVKVERSRVTGELISIEWTHVDDDTRLYFVDLNEVVGVTTRRRTYPNGEKPPYNPYPKLVTDELRKSAE
jgi:hypothetical protein